LRIIVDENIPLQTVHALRDAGHSITDYRGTPDMGLSDELLWNEAQAARALVITTDEGFVHRAQARHHGLLVVRLRRPNREKIHSRVMDAMARFTAAEWPGLTVIVRDRTRSVRKTGHRP
jgi:predicted nuclease of predicted toxin-antitoxin system